MQSASWTFRRVVRGFASPFYSPVAFFGSLQHFFFYCKRHNAVDDQIANDLKKICCLIWHWSLIWDNQALKKIPTQCRSWCVGTSGSRCGVVLPASVPEVPPPSTTASSSVSLPPVFHVSFFSFLFLSSSLLSFVPFSIVFFF